MSSPSASSPSTEPTGSVVPGMIGTPAFCIAVRAAVLFPISSIAAGGGPLQRTAPARPAGRFVPHQRDRGRGRPDPDEARVLDGLREAGVLGEEPIAGVDRLGARA